MGRYLFCGDRHWDDKFIIPVIVDGLAFRARQDSSDNMVVIEGEAPGADTLACQAAKSHLGLFLVEAYPADWAKYGKSAGPIRNKQMLTEGRPDVVFAFHDDLDASKGTKNMVTQAYKAGVRTYVVSRYR